MVFLFLILIFGAKATVNPHGPTVVSDFSNCVRGLMDFNFKESGLLIFANTNNVSSSVTWIRNELLKRVHEHIKYSVRVISPRNEAPICNQNSDDENHLAVIHKDQFEAMPLADYFIVVIDSYKDFTHVASRLIRSRNWNPHAKFIILFFHFVNGDNLNVFIENILSCLFRHNVINIVVIVPQATNIRNSVIYSWRPYDPPKYCGYFNETARNRLLVENTCERGVVKYKKDIFQDRIPRDMQSCVLYILALKRQPFISEDVKDPNIERLFIDEMARIFNFETNYKIINAFRGERDENGDWDGALKELVTKQGHVLLGGIFPDFDVHEDFECSTSYLADSYTWVVPRAFDSPRWVALFIIFQQFVWYCVIAGFIICALFFNILGHLSDDLKYYKSMNHCFLNTWISLLGFCAYARPVTNSLRAFYIFFNLFCILFLTAYQTKLIDVLTNPTFLEQIDTIEELVKSGLKFGGYEELHDLFYNSSDPFDYYLGEQWIDVDNITTAMIDVAVHRNFSLLCSRLELAHVTAITPELSDSLGNYKYFSFERNMFTVPMEMVTLKGFPFMKHFSSSLEIFKQLGVNAGVRRTFAAFNSRRRATLLRSLESQPIEVHLSFRNLQGGFLALALGLIGGIFALIIELIIESHYVENKLAQFRRCNNCRTLFF